MLWLLPGLGLLVPIFFMLLVWSPLIRCLTDFIRRQIHPMTSRQLFLTAHYTTVPQEPHADLWQDPVHHSHQLRHQPCQLHPLLFLSYLMLPAQPLSHTWRSLEKQQPFSSPIYNNRQGCWISGLGPHSKRTENLSMLHTLLQETFCTPGSWYREATEDTLYSLAWY